ncbi:MAG: serine hydroxymethyltransferase [Bdellovibrionales bacterium]|nr:serine hydroxymethyltransferase [Bdellovibrionales bacterium]
MFFQKHKRKSKDLKQIDPDIFYWIQQERKRQKEGLELIASENYASPAVCRVQGSLLTNKYAEGYPGKRYYGGCKYVDECEILAIERLKQLFQVNHANVQAHSGSQANMAVFLSELKPGDKIMGLDLFHGGHLTHGSPVNFSGLLFQSVFYTLNLETELLDFNQIEDQVKKERPKLMIAGYSAYPRIIDFKAFRQIADRYNCLLLVDMAHIAGLVAGGVHPSPVPYADYVTSTTHKTLRGPRGGFILCQDSLKEKKIKSKIFPGIQGGPLQHVIAAKAVAFKEALDPSFKIYAQQIIKNTKVLEKVFQKQGIKMRTGGSDNHLLLLDFSQLGVTGKQIEESLEKAGITVNKNTVPGEKRSPFVTSGIRIGTAALTTRGMKETEMEQIGLWISKVIYNPSNEEILSKTHQEVKELCQGFPLPTDDL